LANEDAGWIRRNQHRAVWGATAAAVTFVMLSVLHSFRWTANTELFNTLGYSLLEFIYGGALVFVLGAEQGLACRVLNVKPLRYLGLISYTFYLYHWGVLILIEQHTDICFLDYHQCSAIYRMIHSPR
jgi:peptidoglycan/LPS O-acetylase OafA/YrhL